MVKDLVVVFLLNFKRLLIPLTIVFYFQKWNTMVFVDIPLSGLHHIFLTENNMFPHMEAILIYVQLILVYHRAVYWALYFFVHT